MRTKSSATSQQPLPLAVLSQLYVLVRRGYLRRRTVAGQMLLIVLSVVCEALSLSLLLPILKIIESGQPLHEIAKGSRFWQKVIDLFDFLGLPYSLLGLLIIVFAAVILRQLVRYYVLMSTSRLKQQIEVQISLDLYGDILRSHPNTLQTIGTGRFAFIVNNISNGAASILRTHFSFLNSTLVCVTYVSISIIVAPIPSLIGISLAGIVPLLMNRFSLATRILSQQALNTRQAFQNHLTERYRNWRIIKLANTVTEEVTLLGRWTRRIMKIDLTATRISALIDVIVVPLMTGMTLAILYLSVEVLQIQVSQIAFLIMMLIRLEPVVRGFSQQRQSLERFGVQFDEAFHLLDEYRASRETDRGTFSFEQCRNGIEFSNVTYSYPGSNGSALQGASAFIPSRSVTAIVGPSGAGKSTFVDLIARLIEPSEGEIFIDGRNLKDFSLVGLRHGIAYVSQKPVLFDMTIAENIAYGAPAVEREEIRAAARLAGALDFIDSMPEGFETQIGEGGIRLSGGQQQRIGLARAFLGRAPLLILDEPTSAIDFESEEIIKRAIADVVQQRGTTCIIIAHRASAISKANHIIVMDKGRIVVQGDPDVLKGQENWFSRMVESEKSSSGVAAENSN